jgi:hypothetical protein
MVVDPEEQDDDFAVDPGDQRPEDDRQYAGDDGRSAVSDLHDARDDRDEHGKLEDHLDHEWRDHRFEA